MITTASPSSLPPGANPFELLLGTWNLNRTILGQARAHGVTSIERQARNEARYHEQVTLQLASGRSLRGSATYLFRRMSCGLAVYFADTGLLFHELDFTADTHIVTGKSLVATALHRCSADHYHSTYRIRSSDTIEIEHRVIGPRKDYQSYTTLTRA